MAGVNEVGVGKVVQLGDVLPAIGSEDSAERFAALDDMHAATHGRGPADSDCLTTVGDDVARIDQVEVAGRNPPCGQRPQASSRCYAGQGVAAAHGHAHVLRNRGGRWNGRTGGGHAESPVDDLYDALVVRTQRGFAGLAVAVVAADRGRRQRLVIHARNGGTRRGRRPDGGAVGGWRTCPTARLRHGTR